MRETSASSDDAPRRGFTLVEMLVIIAIIVVLLGLALPSLAAIGAEARSTQCRSNLRQQFAALESFRQAREGLLANCEPLPVYTDDGPEGGLNEALAGYLPADSPIWICPEDTDSESLDIGSSYLYLPGLYILSPEIQFQLPPDVFSLPAATRRTLESRLVTSFYETEGLRSIPLLMDSQDRHFIGTREPRNGVYMDGSSRIVVLESVDEEE